LFKITQELGPPQGPTRAIASGVHEEWEAACRCPALVAQLLEDAVDSVTRDEGEKSRG
jgi:hypothetical protein